MPQTAHHFFPPDHPTASGHFPGNPIIPGAVLLDAVVSAIEADGAIPSSGYTLTSAKFLHPVRPGDHVEIRWRSVAGGQTRFECLLGERSVLNGSLDRNRP